MKKQLHFPPVNIISVIATLLIFLFPVASSYAQQHIIANKNNTRPEINARLANPAFITSFKAARGNGINEISWTASNETDTRKYIVEYSFNGVDYQSAGEVLVAPPGRTVPYTFRHTTLDERAALYRIRIELLNDRFALSNNIMLDGMVISPIEIYPTMVTGQVVNINSLWPIDRVIIVSGNGVQMLEKDLNGQQDFIPIAIPALSKGLYLMTFYGKGWKTTTRFIIP